MFICLMSIFSDYIKQLPATPIIYSRPVKNGHSIKYRKLVFNTNYRLMQVKNIALQSAEMGAFRNTFDLREATICHYMKDLRVVYF